MEGDDAGLSWRQPGQDIDGEAAGNNSGKSLTLYVDVKTLAIGAKLNYGSCDSSGHVRVYSFVDDVPSWIVAGEAG